MTPDVRHELEGVVEELRALITRLKQHDQPLPTQLLEMAVLEIRRRIYDIRDDEFEALIETLSEQGSPGSRASPSGAIELDDQIEQPETTARTMSPARVVAIGDIRRRSKRKRRS